jgi:hypothetical protein
MHRDGIPVHPYVLLLARSCRLRRVVRRAGHQVPVQRRRIAKDLRVGNRGRQLLDRAKILINRRHQLTDSAILPAIRD